MVERVHHSLKASLMARCQGPDWKAQFPWVLLSLCIAPRANGDPSPAEKVYGETLTLPGEFFPADSNDPDIPLARLRAASQKFILCQETYVDRMKQFRPRAPDSCRFVFEGKAFFVSVGGREDWVSIDRLKPAIIPDEDDPAEGPRKTPTPLVPDSAPKRRRGRPRKAVEPLRPTTRGGILLSGPQDDEDTQDATQPRESRTQGLLQLPARFR
ncbi:uncharacterized protein LOC135212831 [Macrobrachium nipponense]|uniref:uncharacterized protein LOC135212831 n=1 Tax=Macrobrachium nipponense TaxID=159736 RepID=UPI0030C7CD2B